jgi:hypothetical protein
MKKGPRSNETALVYIVSVLLITRVYVYTHVQNKRVCNCENCVGRNCCAHYVVVFAGAAPYHG